MPNRSLPAVRLLCAAVMLAAAAMTNAAQASADAQNASNVLKMKPGAYVESAIGWNGPIEVKTTVSDNRIDSIEILKSDEVPYIADEPMKAIIQKVVSEQNLSVDVVTGASRSSEALLRAVGQAVQAAGATSSSSRTNRYPLIPQRSQKVKRRKQTSSSLAAVPQDLQRQRQHSNPERASSCSKKRLIRAAAQRFPPAL